MPPIVLTVLQILFLLLLYLFVARAVRAVVRDVAPPAAPAGTRRRPRAEPEPPPAAQRAHRPESSQGSHPSQPSAPARAAPGELVVHATSGAPWRLPLNGDEITLGRGEGASVSLGDPYTSDRHASLYREGGEWLVVDLGSTNGTFLNQVKVTGPTPIAAGDQLGLGRTVIEVRK